MMYSTFKDMYGNNYWCDQRDKHDVAMETKFKTQVFQPKRLQTVR